MVLSRNREVDLRIELWSIDGRQESISIPLLGPPWQLVAPSDQTNAQYPVRANLQLPETTSNTTPSHRSSPVGETTPNG